MSPTLVGRILVGALGAVLAITTTLLTFIGSSTLGEIKQDRAEAKEWREKIATKFDSVRSDIAAISERLGRVEVKQDALHDIVVKSKP